MPQPSFDKWTSLFLVVASVGFFIGLLLVTHNKGNKRANRILGSLILLFSYNLLLFSFYWAGYSGIWGKMLLIALCSYFLFGPLLLWYWRCCNQQKMRYTWLHALPFILNLVYVLPIVLEYTRELGFIYHSQKNVGFIISKIIQPAYGLSAIGYSVYFYHLAKWGKQRRKLLTPLQKQQQRWLFQLSLYFWIFSFSLILYIFLVQAGLMKIQHDYIISFTSAVFIYLTGIKGFRQPELFGYENGNGRKPANGKYEKSSLSKSKTESIAAELRLLMEEKKVYLDGDLTLQSLAGMLHCSTHHLSQVINEQFEFTYPEYINQHRIEEARHILASPKFQEEKILGVAFEVGYNNKTTFNIAFKKITGLTPSEYRKIAANKNPAIDNNETLAD